MSHHHHHLQSPLNPQPSVIFSPKHHFRVYKRRRLKPICPRPLRCLQLPFQSQFENLIHSLSSQFAPHDFLPPALAFASAAALSFSQRFTGQDRSGSQSCDIGEWILFSSPTPFNRFVLLRCPSISFKGSELLEDVNERLVTEDRHFVKLSTGRIQVRVADVEQRGVSSEPQLEYQRLCIAAEDGGVISLDWPEDLDLKEERGLDSTLLLVPGTAEGSMNEDVKAFVLEALKRGFFPVVMNPRGCAGSPLTTARLFTAADSDDISTAIHFVSKARPWAMLMGVGWGFGANMLTKYLEEVGERTPLTAATCINNPFDLEEATRSFPCHVAIDEKLAGGLKEILRANKELFQGKRKGFDVEKALSTNSVRDFDKAISMVSYECGSIKEFYSRSSTRDLVGNVKVPLLFIQNDDGTVPLFSIPREKIAENPYTSLLLCSCTPSGETASKYALSWCQHLTVEWFTAVELGLLKGRHPLLKDIDISINPSKGLSLVEGNALRQTTKVSKFLELNEANRCDMGKVNKMLEDGDFTTRQNFGSLQDPRKESGKVIEEFRAIKNGGVRQSDSFDADLIKEEEESSVDVETGQVLQSAKVVMNILDVTMPGVLTEDGKTKVLTAVSQGETLMKALNDAVPEDVRGKLAETVSGILRAPGANLKINRIQDISRFPRQSPTSKSKDEEVVSDISGSDASSKDYGYTNEVSKDEMEGSEDVSFEDHLSKYSSGMELDPHSSCRSVSSCEDKTSRDTVELVNSSDSEETSSQKATDLDVRSRPESASAREAVTADANAGLAAKAGVDSKRSEEINSGALSEERIQTSTITAENVQPSSEVSFDANPGLAVKAGVDGKRSEETSSGALSEEKIQTSPITAENVQSSSEVSSVAPTADKDKSTPSSAQNSNNSSFSITEALNALTGMDDSTQMAVNSVFGVLEDMITKLEESSDDEDRDGNDVKSIADDTSAETHKWNHREAVEKEEVFNKEYYSGSQHNARYGFDKEKPVRSSERQDTADGTGKGENIETTRSVNNRRLDNNVQRLRPVNGVPFYATPGPYESMLRNEYIRRYLFSKLSMESLDKDTTAALLLDYIPEEGQWKLLEKPRNNGDATDSISTNGMAVDIISQNQSSARIDSTRGIIETSYVVMDTDVVVPPLREYSMQDRIGKQSLINNTVSFQPMLFIKKIILDCLKVELNRRITLEDMKEKEPCLVVDCELVANAVCTAVGCDEEVAFDLKARTSSIDRTYEKIATLPGELIVETLSSAVQKTTYLKGVLPVGVIVGSCLAALREFFNVVSVHDNVGIERAISNGAKYGTNFEELHEIGVDHPSNKQPVTGNSNNLLPKEDKDDESKETRSSHVMVGVVTAALGTSALLVNQQDMSEVDESVGTPSNCYKEEAAHRKELGESEKDHSNLVTSLAEKAMSVAAPVMPTKEDGEVDQERLVTMLAELGQRGGLLKLVGKVALLWGGLRGAVSFTDKLISFLQIAERPLIQRIIAFICMVLVLWSPVLVPLLPTLVPNWMSHRPAKIAELTCIVGLYAAVIILVMLWGRRIRGYEKPFRQYGLDLTSLHKVHDLLKGMVGGVMLILAIQILNSSIGCSSFCWPPDLPSHSLDAIAKLKAYAKIILLAGQGFGTAIAVAIVEELLFRSWLPEEIATDLGFHWGIILSGLAFAFLQRPLWAFPGLWFLSLGLSGIRHRNKGSLSIPIGLRAGIIASNYILHTGGFVTSVGNMPLWIIGTHPLQPFSGVVGLSFSLVLAVIFYPRESTVKKKTKLMRTIRE